MHNLFEAAGETGAWQPVEIPGTRVAVELWRLHADSASGANVAVVRFPPGWTRPRSGHYMAAEEMVVLQGAVDVAGLRTAGDYVYLPPRTLRPPSGSETGCVVLAYFSTLPQWMDGPPGTPPSGTPVHKRKDLRGTLRTGTPEVPGSFRVMVAMPAEAQPVDRDVYWPESGHWEWLPGGSEPTLLTGPAYVREWQ